MSGPFSRKPLDGFGAIVMLVCCVCWGLQQVAVKVAAPSISPVMQMGVRSLVAALLVCGLVLLRGATATAAPLGAAGKAGGRRGGKRLFWPGIAAGLLFAGEFLFVSLGLGHTSASHMSVFLYTAPIFTVLGLHWLIPTERIGTAQWLGIGAAFAGIALAFADGMGSGAGDWRNMLIGDAMGIVAGIMWAATTVVVRATALSEAPPTTTLLYQLATAAVLLLALAFGSGQALVTAMSSIAWLSMLFQSVIVAFVSYLTWFWMLRRYLASRIAVFSFLTPLFGVGFGVLLLHEPVGLRFIGGAVLVLAGIVLVNLRR
ncbi:DMT family transporter [Undibacterium arcticum]|uniref:DMT family transporter n=1 Tax=Undibacterium arcticum TaxID=1762892 RepID=A0ABV7F5S4_9BURK